MEGLDIMLGRVEYYRSVEFEDLEKQVLMNEGIPKALEKGLFRWENDFHSFEMVLKKNYCCLLMTKKVFFVSLSN